MLDALNINTLNKKTRELNKLKLFRQESLMLCVQCIKLLLKLVELSAITSQILHIRLQLNS